MHIHTKARDMFIHAIHFIWQHMSFTLYYFFLMILSELLQAARSINIRLVTKDVITVGDNQFQQVTDYGVIAKNFLPESFINFLQQPYMPYIFFILTFVLLLVLVGVTFIVQALLRKRDASLVHETTHSLHTLMRAPWAAVYFLVLAAYISLIPYLVTTQDVAAATSPFAFLPFFAVMLVFLVVSIALVYFQQLLYDNYHSLTSVLHTSWQYLKKSWFVLLKFFIIIGALGLLLTTPFMVFGLSFTELPVVMALQFLIRTYITLVGIVGFNMIYLHVRLEK